MGSAKKASKTSQRSTNLARTVIAELLSGRRNPTSALHAVKSLDTVGIDHFFRSVGHIPAIRGAMLGKIRADTYQEIGTTPNPNVPAGSLAAELLFAAHSVAYEKEKIASFVAGRQAFEDALIAGAAAEARQALDAVEAEHGRSIWLIEARVLHPLCLDAEQDIGKLLGQIITEAQGNSYVVLPLLALYVREISARSSIEAAIQHVHQLAKDLPSVSPTTLASWLLRSSPAMLNAQLEEELSNFLRQESALPLVDRYLALRRTLLTLVASEISPELYQAVRAALMLLSRFVQEPWVAYARAVLGDEGPAAGGDESTAMTRCLDLYTVGAYDEAVAVSREAIASHPSQLAFYELHARAVLRSGAAWTPPGEQGSLMAELGQILYVRLQCKARTRESLERLEEMAVSLTGLSIAEQLFRLLPEAPDRRASLSLVFHLLVARGPTPRQLLALGWNSITAACMRRLRRQSPDSVTLAVVAGVLEQDERVWEEVPQLRLTKMRALAAFADGRPQDTLELLDQLRDLRSRPNIDRHELAALRLDALLALGWIEECARLVAELYAGRAQLLVGLPLHRMREVITHDLIQASPSIDWPLALLAAQKFSRCAVDSYDVYVGYDEFLLSRGCERPSELRAPAAAAEDAVECGQLIVFLREACTIPVMNHNPVFESQRDVEDERIELLQWLIELDPSRQAQYADERDKIVRTQTIRDALEHIERSKIYVDADGIRRTMAATLADRFAEINSLSRVEQSVLQLVARQIDVGVLVRAQVRMVERLFVQVFDEVKTSFLRSEEYGLDGNLSIRIRHGTLTGELRVHFERYMLVTRLDSRSGEYERNEYWLRLGGLGSQAAEQLDSALRKFSRAIDRAIETVKDEWLQIHAPDKPKGLFNYAFTDDELRGLLPRAVAADTPEAFGDGIIETLWHRTQENSLTVKQKIEGELRDVLAASLAELEVAAIGARHAGLKSAVERCRGNLQQSLESIAGWFDLHETRVVQDYAFDLVAETCITVVRRSMPRGRRLLSDVQAGIPPLRGLFFDHMLALMHILVDNAVRHGRRDADVRLEVAREPGAIVVRVKNGLASDQAAELRAHQHEYEQRARLERPATEIRQEGGTGFYKLAKILRVDLKTTDYDVALAVGDNDLTTSVRISDKELLA